MRQQFKFLSPLVESFITLCPLVSGARLSDAEFSCTADYSSGSDNDFNLLEFQQTSPGTMHLELNRVPFITMPWEDTFHNVWSSTFKNIVIPPPLSHLPLIAPHGTNTTTISELNGLADLPGCPANYVRIRPQSVWLSRPKFYHCC